jgi:hypothetical protein
VEGLSILSSRSATLGLRISLLGLRFYTFSIELEKYPLAQMEGTWKRKISKIHIPKRQKTF